MPDTVGMDVVYLVRRGQQHEELRYSLRSLERNVTAGTLWVVGYQPRWLRGVEFIPSAQSWSKWENTSVALRAACEDPRISDPFMLWNDDFFALRAPEHLNWNNGRVRTYLKNNPMNSTYRKGCAATLTYLRSQDFHDPLSFELHIPMVVHKTLMAQALTEATGLRATWKRSIYGNRAFRAGLLHTRARPDVKIKDLSEIPTPDQDWVSTHDTSFRRGRIGEWLREAFPEPSRFES